MPTKKQVFSVKKKYSDLLLGIPEVTGVGVGGYDRLRIYVNNEKTKRLLEALFVKEVEGVPIEFVIAGRARAYQAL